MFDAATQSKIALWRRKAVEGTLTEDEMIEAVKLIRQGRTSAAVASEKAGTKRKAASAPLPNGDDLLSEMLG